MPSISAFLHPELHLVICAAYIRERVNLDLSTCPHGSIVTAMTGLASSGFARSARLGAGLTRQAPPPTERGEPLQKSSRHASGTKR